MKTEEIRNLKILEEFEKNTNVSQRILASKLNISLGLVNSFVKKLADKGYFKITSTSKKRLRYILTPEGVTEKTRLTYSYIKQSFEQYKQHYSAIENVFCHLSKSGVKEIALYGVTTIAEIAIVTASNSNLYVRAIIDNNKAGQIFSGLPVIKLDQLESTEYEKIIVTAFDKESYSIDKLMDAGVTIDKIITFNSGVI